MKYLDFFSKLHDTLLPNNYVEIGIREGASLSLAKGLAVGIDPQFNIKHEIQCFAKLFRCKSDDFFAQYDLRTQLDHQSCQLAFIDGLHLFEYALRDFKNIEMYCEPESIVIFDDIRPRNFKEAGRQPTGGAWTGDIWKIYSCLHKYRPDLKLSLIKTEPTGLLLVTNLDSTNKTLWNTYNNIVGEFLAPDFPEYPNTDYFSLFIKPEFFLESEMFHNIKSRFDNKFNNIQINEDIYFKSRKITRKSKSDFFYINFKDAVGTINNDVSNNQVSLESTDFTKINLQEENNLTYKVQHFIITRFNINLGAYSGKNISPSWLEHRANLFKEFCIPSVKQQSVQDFSWFVLFDPRTEKDYLDKIIIDEVIQPIFADNLPSALNQIKSFIHEDTDILISSRLDNDDAIMSEYIKASREFSLAIYNQKEVLSIPAVINFSSGWELAKDQLFARYYPANHFQSMVSVKTSEKNPDFSMIINYHHSHVHKQFNVVNLVTNIPMWLIVVHAENIGNVVKGNPLDDRNLELLEKYFGIKNKVSFT
jgi:Putative rhamnosyl transferase